MNNSKLPFFSKKAGSLLLLMILISALTISCAAQHKFKKKAEPCPCEKTNKR